MRAWPEEVIHANGIDIHYYRTGGDNKPPLILLHGVTDSGLCWSRVAHEFEHRYDVILPDARGHGHSSGIETGFSSEILARDVLALIEQLQIDKPFLFGHSMGARTALLVASLSDQIQAIILEDPPLVDIPQPQTNTQENQRRWQWIFDLKALSNEQREALCHVQNPHWAEEEIGPWAASKGDFHLDVIQHINAIISPWRERIASINCLILLITGDPERGAIVTPEIAQEFLSLNKQGTVVHIEGAGHNIHRDRYDPTMAAVSAFLQRYSV